MQNADLKTAGERVGTNLVKILGKFHPESAERFATIHQEASPRCAGQVFNPMIRAMIPEV